jgi:purine-nucleoside phosphorylase
MKDYLSMAKESAEYLKSKIGKSPLVSIVLGSGLGNLAESISDKKEIYYEQIPNFPKTTVPGHDGLLICGNLCGRSVIAMKGRFHYYEGWSMQEVVFPLRVFKLLGINNLILTNAAGAVNIQFKPGDLMLIRDHIGFFAENPLRGTNIDEFGPRFPDMSYVYDENLIEITLSCAKNLNFEIKQGVYGYTKGPSFETPAEIKALRAFGADAVGMSTVPEAISAKHMRMKILGISCITNMAAGVTDKPLTHEEVIETGKMVEKKFEELIMEIIRNWP